MSTFREKITLVNARDIGNAREGLIPESKIRGITVDAMPDTGAWTLVIDEETSSLLRFAHKTPKNRLKGDFLPCKLPKQSHKSWFLRFFQRKNRKNLQVQQAARQKLGLAVEGSIASTLADGSTTRYGQTEAVKIQWKNRSTTQQALLVPDARDILLGALPLEAMDLMVDPVHERLTGVHGNQPLHVLY